MVLHNKIIIVLSLLVALFSSVSSFSSITPSPIMTSQIMDSTYVFKTINGQSEDMYGKGIYENMSVKNAVSQIAQDKVTLFLGVPLLLVSIYMFRRNLFKGKIMLSGVLIYFLTVYMFNMTNTYFNGHFLYYVLVTSFSFFALVLLLTSFDVNKMSLYFSEKLPVTFIGGFLMFGALATAFSWLGLIVPALTTGEYPLELGSNTTMVIQGFDLALYLPVSFLAGFFIFKRKNIGFVMAPIYLVFLTILMISVTFKLTSVYLYGIETNTQQLFVFPLFTIISLVSTFFIFKSIRMQKEK